MEKMLQNKRTIMILILPALLLFLAFIPIPTMYLFGISLFKSDMLNPAKFVGLQNYIFLFSKDPYFWSSLCNNIFWMLGNMVLQVLPSFLLAWILTSKVRCSNVYKGILFLPVALSSTAISIIWYFVYHGKVGILNQCIRILTGNEAFDKSWLLDPKFALIGVMFASAWQWIGYYMVLFCPDFQPSRQN